MQLMLKISSVVALVLFNVSVSEGFDMDRWLEINNEKIRSCGTVEEWMKEYEAVCIEPSFDSNTGVITFSIEFSDSPLDLKQGETFKFYGINNFKQIEVEKKFSYLWYAFTLTEIFSNGKLSRVPKGTIKVVRFIMDAKNMEIANENVLEMPSIRKEVKKKIFEYKPIEGFGKTKLYLLDPIIVYEKVIKEND